MFGDLLFMHFASELSIAAMEYRRELQRGDPRGINATAEVMQRIAAPMIGGMVTVTLLTLLVIPALFLLWHRRGLPAGADG